MDRNIVEIKNLTKRYKDFLAVDNINFSIKQGELLAILGPNGAGKTTTLECLEGLLDATSGKILIDGFDVKTKQSSIRKILGVQLQSSSLPLSMTVEECMELFCSYHNISPRYDLLERFQLKDLKKKCYGQLSVGQQRRVVLAIAMAHRPKLLILDEPTAGLDVVSRIELHNVIQELKDENTSILLASHDMAEVEKLADKVVVLLKGKVVKYGKPDEIAKSVNELTKILVKTKKALRYSTNEEVAITNSTLKITEKVDDYYVIYSEDINSVLTNLVRCIELTGNKIVDLKIERPNLEETFIKLTKIGG